MVRNFSKCGRVHPTKIFLNYQIEKKRNDLKNVVLTISLWDNWDIFNKNVIFLT